MEAHLLDSLGCALGVLDAAPIRRFARNKSKRKAAAPVLDWWRVRNTGARNLYNSALVRYLDFMDAYAACRARIISAVS